MNYFARTFSAVALAALAPYQVSLGQQLPAAPSFITVDFPGATTTHLWGINSRGEMVGLYIAADASLIGFLLIGDHFTSIDFPGASLTEANL